MSKFRNIFLVNAITIFLSLFISFYLYAEEINKNNHSAGEKKYLSKISTLLKQKYPNNRTINIVCHGDSVPCGYRMPPVVDSLNSYPYLLYKGLKARFPYAVVNIIISARASETSIGGAKRFDHDVISHRPDVVTIDYALNDRLFLIGMGKAKKAWISMIEKATAKEIKVILLTPTPSLLTEDDPYDPLNQYAEQVRRLAKEYKVGLVDSLKAFHQYVKDGGKIQELMSTTNHPNQKGHAIIAKKLLKLF